MHELNHHIPYLHRYWSSKISALNKARFRHDSNNVTNTGLLLETGQN
jgi:hypothetical protein